MRVRRRTFSQPQLADTLLEHPDTEKMDKMAVGKWRPKHAIALPAHVLTIIDKVDQHVRTKPSVTIELSNVASPPRMAPVVCKGEGLL